MGIRRLSIPLRQEQRAISIHGLAAGDTIQRYRKTSFEPGGWTKYNMESEGITALEYAFHYAVQTASGSSQFLVTKNGYISTWLSKS